MENKAEFLFFAVVLFFLWYVVSFVRESVWKLVGVTRQLPPWSASRHAVCECRKVLLSALLHRHCNTAIFSTAGKLCVQALCGYVFRRWESILKKVTQFLRVQSEITQNWAKKKVTFWYFFETSFNSLSNRVRNYRVTSLVRKRFAFKENKHGGFDTTARRVWLPRWSQQATRAYCKVLTVNFCIWFTIN